jgi:excisionase family DNA binding protein
MCQGHLYDFEEAAGLLGISPSTLRKKAAAGVVPFRKVFRRTKFSDDDLMAIQVVHRPPAKDTGTGRRRARP